MVARSPHRCRILALVASLGALAGVAAPSAASEGSGEAALLFTIGRLEAQEGDVGQARASLEAAVELEPADPYVRLELASLLASVGDWDEASKQVTEARKLAPTDPNVIRAFGRLHLYQVRENPAALGEALEAFEDLRARTPSDLESLTSLARIYQGQGKYLEAAEVYQQVLDYWPGHMASQAALVDVLIRGERKDQAEERLAEFLELTPEATQLRVILADLLSERGAHDRAVEVLRSSAAQGDPELGRRLAIELYRVGELEEALRYLEEWVEAEPGEPRARYLQSLLLSSLGRDEDALSALEDLRDRRPGEAEVAVLVARHHLQRQRWENVESVVGPFLTDGVQDGEEELALQSAAALRAMGRPSRALERLEPIESHPVVGLRARASRAEILYDSNREAEAGAVLTDLAAEGAEGLRLAASVYQGVEAYERSIGVLEALLALEPEGMDALFWLGAAYERTQRYGEAEDTFLRLLAIAPDFAPALNYLGYMWAERGRRLDEAVELVQKAVDLEPENGAYVDSLGWALFQSGETEAARGHLERAALLVGEDPTVLEHLGDVYVVLGREVEAADAYRQALELAGENRAVVEKKLRDLSGGR